MSVRPVFLALSLGCVLSALTVSAVAEEAASKEAAPKEASAQGASGKGASAKAASAKAALAAEVQLVETRHYRLHYVGSKASAEEAGRVLEAAWPAFEKHFGSAPRLRAGERLCVRFSATREAWQRGIRADGTRPPRGAGGYYWPRTRTAHLYRQPTAYFTRTLLLHEAAHQFHYLARTRNRAPRAHWYIEGVAEHLSWHRWDGKTLELGIVPGVSLKDFPAAALKELREEDFDLKLVIGGQIRASRPLSWALYTWFATGAEGQPLPGFSDFRRELDGGGRPGGVVHKYFGEPRPLHARLVSWLEKSQSPWSQAFNEWEQTGPRRFRGHARVVTACRCKRGAQVIGATLEVPAAGRWRGGLLLHWTDAEDYTVAMLDRWGGVQVNRRRDGRWKRLHRSRIRRARSAESHDLVAVREGAGVSFWIDGDEIGAWTLPAGPMGLCVEACDLQFRDVDAR